MLFSIDISLTGIFKMQEVCADLVYIFIYKVVNMDILYQKYSVSQNIRACDVTLHAHLYFCTTSTKCIQNYRQILSIYI